MLSKIWHLNWKKKLLTNGSHVTPTSYLLQESLKKNEIKRQERERMLQAPQTAMTTDLTKKKKKKSA